MTFENNVCFIAFSLHCSPNRLSLQSLLEHCTESAAQHFSNTRNIIFSPASHLRSPTISHLCSRCSNVCKRKCPPMLSLPHAIVLEFGSRSLDLIFLSLTFCVVIYATYETSVNLAPKIVHIFRAVSDFPFLTKSTGLIIISSSPSHRYFSIKAAFRTQTLQKYVGRI